MNIPENIVHGPVEDLIGTMAHESLHRLGHGWLGTGLGSHAGPGPDQFEMIPPSGVGTVENNVEALIDWTKSWINPTTGRTIWEQILLNAKREAQGQ